MADQRIAESLNRIIELHKKKNSDYSHRRNYENFEIAATLMEFFEKPQDKVFACIIGIKMGRLATLLNSDRPANNESVEDTFDDQTLYTQLWKYGRADVREYLGMDKDTGNVDPYERRHIVLTCTCGHLHSMHRPACNTVGCPCQKFINKLDMR